MGKVIFEQSNDVKELAKHVAKESIHGKRNCQRKGPKVGVLLVCSETKEATLSIATKVRVSDIGEVRQVIRD